MILEKLFRMTLKSSDQWLHLDQYNIRKLELLVLELCSFHVALQIFCPNAIQLLSPCNSTLHKKQL